MKLFDSFVGLVSSNKIFSDYSDEGDVSRIGFEESWLLKVGRCRKTGQAASILILEKKELNKYNETTKELMTELLLYGVRVLQTFQHPSIVKVLCPITESKEMYAVAIESIDCILSSNAEKSKDIVADFAQILDAAEYLHTNFNMNIGYISDYNIVIASDGSWKLCFLDFLSQNSTINERIIKAEKIKKINWTFACPSIPANSVTNISTDIYHLLLLFIHLNNNHNQFAMYIDTKANNNISLLAKLQSHLSDLYKGLPHDFINCCLAVFSQSARAPKSIQEILNKPPFNTIDVQVVKSIHSFGILSYTDRVKFSKTLMAHLDEVSEKIIENKVLPVYLNFCSNLTHSCDCLEVVIEIWKKSKSSFISNQIKERVAAFFEINEDEIKLILMRNYSFFLSSHVDANEKWSPKLINLLKSGLTSQSHEIQMLSLTALKDNFEHKLIRLNYMSLFPALKECLLRATHLDVQVNTIITLSQTFKYLKEGFMLKDIVLYFAKIQVAQAATSISLIGAFKNILQFCADYLDAHTIAIIIVPSILRNSQSIRYTQGQLAMHFQLINKYLLYLNTLMMNDCTSDSNCSLPDNNNPELLNFIKSEKSLPSMLKTTENVCLPTSTATSDFSNLFSIPLQPHSDLTVLTTDSKKFSKSSMKSDTSANKKPHHNSPFEASHALNEQLEYKDRYSYFSNNQVKKKDFCDFDPFSALGFQTADFTNKQQPHFHANNKDSPGEAISKKDFNLNLFK